MALPMMNTPTYNMVVPSSGVSVKFRPFLVKEEKLLLIAVESDDEQTIMDSIKQIEWLKVIKENCINREIVLSILANKKDSN